jgi:hypothetical protein
MITQPDFDFNPQAQPAPAEPSRQLKDIELADDDYGTDTVVVPAPAPSGIPQVSLVGEFSQIRRIKFQERSCKLPPQIRLSGQWLIEAGFHPGERVEVCISAMGGEILIRRPQPTQAEQARDKALQSFKKLGL